jgi:hypothetical protein
VTLRRAITNYLKGWFAYISYGSWDSSIIHIRAYISTFTKWKIPGDMH